MDFMHAIRGIALLSILFLNISQAFSLPSNVSFLIIGMLADTCGFALITDESRLTNRAGHLWIVLSRGSLIMIFLNGPEAGCHAPASASRCTANCGGSGQNRTNKLL